MNNFENRVKQNYTLKGEMQGTFPFEQYITPISYAVAYPLDKKDIIFCNILHIKGGKLLKHTFAELLGFSIMDIPEQKKYKDLGEESIFNALLQKLKFYNLIIETKEEGIKVKEGSNEELLKEKLKPEYPLFIQLTKDGENAVITNQKFKYYQANLKSYQSTKKLIVPFDFPFLEIFSLEVSIQNEKEISLEQLPIFCNQNKNRFNEISLFLQKENKLLYTIQDDNGFSTLNQALNYHYYLNDNHIAVVLVYQNNEYAELLTQIINKPENLEFKNNLIYDIRFKTLWEDKNRLIDSLTITEFFKKWNWNELANRNLDWEDEQVLSLFNENANINVWHTLTNNIPENYLLLNFEKYTEKWDWSILSERLSDKFIFENITNQDYKWNFEILSFKDFEFVKTLIKKVKEYNQNSESLIIAEWDFFALSENLDNDFIYDTITENIGLDFDFISKKEPDFILTLLQKIQNHNNNVELDFQIPVIWDWKYISETWQVETIWENVDLLSPNIVWHIFLNRIFADIKNKEKYINDKKFIQVITEYKSKIYPLFTTQNILWDKNLVEFLDNLDLLLWYSNQSQKGFECNDFITDNIQNFEKFKDKLQTKQGYDSVSKNINSTQFLYQFPDFQWNWDIVFENKKLEKTSQLVSDFKEKWNWIILSQKLEIDFIEQNIRDFEFFWSYDILSQRLSDNFFLQNLNNFSWNFEVLSKRGNNFIQNTIQENQNFTLLWHWEILADTLEIDFIKSILPQLNDKYAQILPSSIANFWKKITQRIDFEFIENNLDTFVFIWDWTYLTQNLKEDYILENLLNFAEYWDWSHITQHTLNKIEITELLTDREVNHLFSKYWDWQYLITYLFTIEEFIDDIFFRTIAFSLNKCEGEKQKYFWALLTKKLESQPNFLKEYMKIGLKNTNIRLDYDFLSNYRRFGTNLTLNFIQQYQEKWNWDILSKNTDINTDWKYLSKFSDKWDWSYISLRSNFLKGTNLSYFQDDKLNKAKEVNLNTLDRFKDKIDWQALSKRQDVIFDDTLIEKFIDKGWDFFALSNSKGLRITNEFLLKYAGKDWDYQALSQNKSLNFNFYKIAEESEKQDETNVLIELKDKNWDWEFLSTRNDVELRHILFRETLDKDWKWKEITSKLDFNGIEAFLDLLQDKDIDWEYVQTKAKFKPTPEIIEKYADKWDWELFSQNENLEIDVDFIKKHTDKWNFYTLTNNKILLESIDNFIEFPNKNWNFSFLISKKEFLTNLSFLEIFADKLDWNTISKSELVEFSPEWLEKFKWQWNFNVLQKNILIERNEEFKSAISEILLENPTIRFIYELEKQGKNTFIYHFSHLSNAVKILKDMAIKSRNTAQQINNSAGTVIDSSYKARDYARFYYRPQTPAQFYNQNLGKQPSDNTELKTWYYYGHHSKIKYRGYYDKARQMGFPKCPVPIFFKIDVKEVLQKNMQNCFFSNGNLQTSWANILNFLPKTINSFNFNNVFDTIENTKGDDFERLFELYKNASQQEFLVINELKLHSLDSLQIICQNEADKETLINLIGNEHPLINKITCQSYGLYHNTNKRFRIYESNNELHIQTDFEDNGIISVRTNRKNTILEVEGNIYKKNAYTIEGEKNLVVHLAENTDYQVWFRDTNAYNPQNWLLYATSEFDLV